VNNLEKFRELLLTDEEFQNKLKTAAEAYTGEQTEEAVFNNVIVPFAAEYGITGSFEEFKDYLNSLSDSEIINNDELSQIAGGDSKGGGIGSAVCLGIGMGIGGNAGKDGGGLCVVVGAGWGASGCAGEGTVRDLEL